MARLYVPVDVNFPDDPKIVEAGPDAEHLYLRGLLLAKRIGGDGVLARGHLYRLCGDFACILSGDTNPDDLAKALVAADLWRETDGGWQITAWLVHNPSDAEISSQRESERDRKARWRQSRPDTTVADAAVPPGQPVTATPRDAHESESESESELGGARSAPPPPPKTNGSKRGTRCPAEFAVSDAMVEWVERECAGLDWDRETKKFVNYWAAQPGQRGVKLDWVATWRTWMLKASDYAGSRR
jgi:hypothetical protein